FIKGELCICATENESCNVYGICYSYFFKLSILDNP
ncbi:hypothetical protein D043_0205B, partial [Vibrio parahaemolyticus EKP-021]